MLKIEIKMVLNLLVKQYSQKQNDANMIAPKKMNLEMSFQVSMKTVMEESTSPLKRLSKDKNGTGWDMDESSMNIRGV